MTATPIQFITELQQSVESAIGTAMCFYGHAPQSTRSDHVVFEVDTTVIDAEMDHDEAHVAARVTFSCRSYSKAIDALKLAQNIHLHFRNFNGELVVGGNAQIELAEREGLANAPLYEGDQTHWLELLSYLFIYRED